MADINEKKLDWLNEAQRFNTYLDTYGNREKKYLHIENANDFPENWDEVESVFIVCEKDTIHFEDGKKLKKIICFTILF